MQTTDTAQITVRLNGEAREVPEGLSVEKLLLHLELHPKLVVVEHNGDILRRDGYGAAQVRDGDNLELVHFVGGG
ncbi:MAG TPA: sulfur carrier protein ThiS [Longimicrobiaceae bacterium]|nr:sulfur carrier protein ThiS [Longimicrobiaceae bacterium]